MKNSNSNYEIDDMSYIAEMKHTMHGIWHCYDVEIAASGYGWEDILDWADYLVSVDLDDISKATKNSFAGEKEEDILHEYNQYKSFKEMPSLKEENGILSIGGISKALKGHVMIVWFNQSKSLRFFTMKDYEELMIRYVETMIRRTFNSPDAMKLARPVKE